MAIMGNAVYFICSTNSESQRQWTATTVKHALCNATYCGAVIIFINWLKQSQFSDAMQSNLRPMSRNRSFIWSLIPDMLITEKALKSGILPIQMHDNTTTFYDSNCVSPCSRDYADKVKIVGKQWNCKPTTGGVDISVEIHTHMYSMFTLFAMLHLHIAYFTSSRQLRVI